MKKRRMKRMSRLELAKAGIKTGDVLISTTPAKMRRGKAAIEVMGGSESQVIKKAQPIISRSKPPTKFRYAKLKTDPYLPWFKKGE